jgi:hypothetical protein
MKPVCGLVHVHDTSDGHADVKEVRREERRGGVMRGEERNVL